MDSQDQQDNSQNDFLNLPVELHYEITSYLSTFNIKHLSHTSAVLRNIYNPILYRNCKVSDQYQCVIVPKTYWMVPFWLLYSPSNYSWYPNQAVRNIVVNDQFSITDLQHYIKPSDYPSLVSFKVVPETYRSQLVITLQNPMPFAKRDLKIPHLSTNEFLPAAKSYERVIKCPTRTGPYYVLQCNNTEMRSMIASLNLNFQEEVEGRWRESVANIAKELGAYVNLKDLKIWCSDRSNYESFKAVIESVTKLESLESLMIYYQSTYKDTKHLDVLDNLKGNWKKFDLCLGMDQCISTSGLFLRLPTVTNLMLSYDDRYYFNYNLFKGNFEFGSGIKQLTFPFHSAGEFLSEYHRSQNVLDNLTTLKVVFPPAPHRIFYKEDIEMVVFTKVLPNLKNFEIQMQDIKLLPERQLDWFPKLSKTFFSLVPFGEFDILNYESIKPYILGLRKSALKKWHKHTSKVKIINRCVESLENANEDSNIYDLYHNLFVLQFFHSAIKSGCYSRNNNNDYSKHRTIISVLLLRLLQYTPNLETLTLLGVPLHEEFAAFHRLVKYHKHLKRVSARMIFIGNMKLDYHTNPMYSQFCQFVKAVRHEIHDNQVFVTEPIEITRGCILEGIDYDVEGFRNHYVYNFSVGTDGESDWHSFTEGGECTFAEILPLNINEVKDYRNRQDLLNRFSGLSTL